MRPLLKNYVALARTSNGVYIEAGQRSFVIAGGDVYPLVSRLLAALDGKNDWAKLSAALPARARPLLDQIIDELQRHQMVHLLDAEATTQLPAKLEEKYENTIAFIQNLSPHYAMIFMAWRESHMTVVGAGDSFTALVHGLVKSGVRRLRLALEAGQGYDRTRAQCEAVLERERAAGLEFECKWIEPVDFLAGPSQGSARLLYVNDALSLDHPSPHLQALLKDCSTRKLFGGIVQDNALLGPEIPAGELAALDIWRRIPSPSPALPYSAAICSVLGSLMAFQTLKATVHEQLPDQNARDWSRHHLLRLSAGGEITAHPLKAPLTDHARSAALAGQPNGSRDAMEVAERRKLEQLLEPAFDPLTGFLSWTDEIEADFPLVHRALRISTSNEPLTIVQWGLTPQDVGLRTLCRAAEVAAAIQERPATPRTVPITALPERTVWRQLALAHAIVRSPLFCDSVRSYRIALSSIADPVMQMLCRIARLYQGTLPNITLHSAPGLAAYLAEADVAGTCAVAVAASPLAAMVESLGNALSLQQCPGQGATVAKIEAAWQGGPPPRPVVDAHQDIVFAELPLGEEPVEAFGLAVVEHLLELPAFANSSLVIGHITLETARTGR
jgi:hypothetical protein